MRFAITVSLLVAILLAACGKRDQDPTLAAAPPIASVVAASAASAPAETRVALWSAQVYPDPSKYKAGMCPLVDQSMLVSKPPIDPALQAADYWCRADRLPKSKLGEPPVASQAPSIPVVVQNKEGKVFYGLIDRKDLANAKGACYAISSALPAIMENSADTTFLSMMSSSACGSLSAELARDNPLVVLAATDVIARGAVEDVAKLMQKQPELAPVGKVIEDINSKIGDTIRDAVKKPIDWAIKHPEEALKLLQPQVSVIGPEQAKVLAEKTVAFLSAAGAEKEKLAQGAKAVGGDVGKVLEAAVNVVLPPAPAAVAKEAKKAVEDVKKQAERSAEDLRRSDLNPGNWKCC